MHIYIYAHTNVFQSTEGVDFISQHNCIWEVAYIHTYIHTHTRIYIYTCICISLSVFEYTHLYTHMFMDQSTIEVQNISQHGCIGEEPYTYTYIPTYTDTYTYMYTPNISYCI